MDSVMSIGEKLSCIFMTALMKDHGLKAVYIDLSDLIPLSYDFTDGFNDEFYKYMAREIGSRINQATEGEDDVIPVITGYFGVVPGGLLNGVGRGYTDLCAALAAVGVQADELQIWKEVDGIYYILNISMLKLQSKIHEDATVLSLRLMILMTYSCH
nr:hypothetical protein [Dysgonomonas mossii]